MKKKVFLLLTKDAMCREYLPIYGGQYWNGKTPNLDALAEKGTIFTHYYSAAASTVMAFYSMCTGKFAHETGYELYERNHTPVIGETIFTRVKKLGYDQCHIIWDDMWDVLPAYFDYFRNDVQIHSMQALRQGVGPHYIHEGKLLPDIDKENEALQAVEEKVKSILMSEDSAFIWIHLPHVIYGRVAYGTDIDLFDRYLGMIRKYVPDSCIAVSADHGNMNGHKGKLGYGYDLDDVVIRIPLITPRIGKIERYDSNVSAVDLYEILFTHNIPQREMIYADTAYRAQKHRKLAIIKGKYKYVYDKAAKREELYDLHHDPSEQFSIMQDSMLDIDRKMMYPIREEYMYFDWDEVEQIRSSLQKEKERIWRDGSFKVVMKSNIKDMIRPIYKMLRRVKTN